MTFSTNIKDHNNDVMCILPWIHMHPWPDGRVFTCCLSEHDTPVGNLNEQSLEEGIRKTYGWISWEASKEIYAKDEELVGKGI